MKTKLKRKIWTISTFILLTYITLLIIKPTVWTALIPIIIPSAGLTIGIPTYAIIKNTKNNLEKTEQQTIYKQETKNIGNKHTLKKDTTKTQEIYMNLENTNLETKQEKVKVKTKGTIH